MAERRMLAKSIIESDMFSNMPLDSQMLYVRLNLAADDDGFISNPRSIMRMCGASDDCMKILITKKFVLSFEVGDDFVYLIKHWKVHNYLRSDRYKASTFKSLLREVYYDENKAYSLSPGEGHIPCLPCAVDQMDTIGIPAVDQMDTQVRIGKDRKEKGKDSVGKDIGKEDHEEEPAAPIPYPDYSPDPERTCFRSNTSDTGKPVSEETIIKWATRISLYKSRGWDTLGLLSLARNEGVTRSMIEEHLSGSGGS